MSDNEFHLRKLIEMLEAENGVLRTVIDAQSDYQRELRADRDRLNWLSSEEGNQWASRYFETMLEIPPMNRHSIDAARKEAQ